MTGLASPSGGLIWHARALRRRDQWRSLLDPLAEWLTTWPVSSDRLLLLGPSAGWCLPDAFLARFSAIHAVDFDPLAEMFFRWRHRRALSAGVTLTWERTDFMQQLPALLARHADCVVLFANVLGQHRLHCTDAAACESQLASLRTQLAGRCWASFHDRLSGDWLDSAALPAGFRVGRRLSTAELGRHTALGGEWLDHLTTDVLPPNVERLLLPWRLTAGRMHWVELGHVGR